MLDNHSRELDWVALLAGARTLLRHSRFLLVIWGLSLALGAKPALAQEPASDDSQETTENSESLALEAARVQGEHCADAASNRKTEGLRSISTVSNTWVRVSEQYDRSGDNYLLYWRGVLAQCMDQESRAYDDLKGFLEQVGDSSLWAGLVRDARRRIRLLERKTGAAGGGAARASLRNPRPVTGLLLGGSLAATSAAFGIAGAVFWQSSQDTANDLKGPEFAARDGEDTTSFDARWDDGELRFQRSRICTIVSVATGLGAIASFVIAATSKPKGGMAAPLVVPTYRGAAIVWEARW